MDWTVAEGGDLTLYVDTTSPAGDTESAQFSAQMGQCGDQKEILGATETLQTCHSAPEYGDLRDHTEAMDAQCATGQTCNHDSWCWFQSFTVFMPNGEAEFQGLRLWFAGDPPGTDQTDVTVNEVTTTTANLWDWEQTTLTVGGVTHSLGSMQRVWKCASSTGDATYEWISPTPLQGRVVTFTVASSVEGDRRLKHVEFGK